MFSGTKKNYEEGHRGGSPPPAPHRRARPKFITSYLDRILPFLDAKSLLTCGEVSRVWREESNALKLWRQLLDLREEEFKRAGVPIATAPLPLSLSGFTLREMKRIAVQPHLPSRCPVPESLKDEVAASNARLEERDRHLLEQKQQQVAAMDTKERERERHVWASGQPPRSRLYDWNVTSNLSSRSSLLRIPITVTARTLHRRSPNPTLSGLFSRYQTSSAEEPTGGLNTNNVAAGARRGLLSAESFRRSGVAGQQRLSDPTASIPHIYSGLPPEPGSSHSLSRMGPDWEGSSQSNCAPSFQFSRRGSHHALPGGDKAAVVEASPPPLPFRRLPPEQPPSATVRPPVEPDLPEHCPLPTPEKRHHPLQGSDCCPGSSHPGNAKSLSSNASADAQARVAQSATWASGPMMNREKRHGSRQGAGLDSPGWVGEPSTQAKELDTTSRRDAEPTHEKTSQRRLSSPATSNAARALSRKEGSVSEGNSKRPPGTSSFSAGLKGIPANVNLKPPARGETTTSAPAPSSGVTTTEGSKPSLQFPYELVGPQDLTQHRATVLQRSLEKLVSMLESEGNILANHEILVEAAMSEVPSSRFLQAREECIRLLHRMRVFEEVVVQSLLRDASRQQRSVVPYPPPPREPGEVNSPPPLLPKAIQTFVQMELLSWKCKGSPLDRLWDEFKLALPLDDQFYNVRDFLIEWGPEWTPAGKSRSGRSGRRHREEALATMIQEKVSTYLAPVEKLIELRVKWGKYVPWDQVIASMAKMK